MAFSCLNFSLHSSSYLSNDSHINITFRSCSSKSVVVGEARRYGFQITNKNQCSLLLKETKISATFRDGSSSFSLGKRKQNFRIYNELQPPVRGAKESDLTISIPEIKDVSLNKEGSFSVANHDPDLDDGNGGSSHFSGSSGSGKFPPGGGNSGGNGNNEEHNEEDDEFGPVLKYDEIVREQEARGISLPADMLEAAKTVGIQKVLLYRYLDMQGSAWPLGAAMKSCSIFRNIMLADPSFLFKVGTEIVIDCCCATLAEVKKRGKDFWAEFELYAADLLVGVVVTVALVGLLAPYARIGKPSTSKGFWGNMARAYDALPSSVFEAGRPGCTFSVRQRIETYFFKGVLYGAAGFMCGLVGQGIANLIMTAKRTVKKSEEDVPVPPLIKSAALWGVFLAISSNTRYQIINGMERLVEASPVARRIPPVAMAFTVGVRLANNIYGGMQFVDWARWTGVQ